MTTPFHEVSTEHLQQEHVSKFYLSSLERAFLCGAYSSQEIQDELVRCLATEASGVTLSPPNSRFEINQYFTAAAALTPLAMEITFAVQEWQGVTLWSASDWTTARQRALRHIDMALMTARQINSITHDDAYDALVDDNLEVMTI